MRDNAVGKAGQRVRGDGEHKVAGKRLMREQEITIVGRDASMAGTLTMPDDAGPWPVVLCLHGSGPLDRDENLGKVQRLDIFNTIAADLAARGISTLRYDKRGCGQSTGDYYSAGHTDLMDDARACLRELEADRRFSTRFALGHSAGTLMAAELSLDHDLAGIVLLNPFVARIDTMLREQAVHIENMLRERRGLAGAIGRMLMGILGTPRTSQERLIARIKAGNAPVLRQGLRRLPAKWFRQMMAIDAAGIYGRVSVPTLIVGGGKDLQCDPADVGRIAALVGERATPVLIEDLTHLLRRDAEPASFAAYPRLIAQPMDAGVVRIVGEWLAARMG